MRSLIRSAVLSATLCSVAATANAGAVIIQNELAACVTVKASETETKTNFVSVKTSFQLRKSIGDCGCFSARATYTSSIDNGGVREVLQQGVIVIKQDTAKALVLASEPALIANQEIQVRLTCAGPI